MKEILLSFFVVFAVCFFPAEGRAQTEDLPILPATERDPRTFCPYDKSFSKDHLLLLVDVTDGLSEQQIKLFENNILTEELLGKVGLYGRVSLVILDNNEPVTGIEPSISICRPKSGDPKSKDKRDHFDIMTENRQKIDIEYRLGYLRRLKTKSVELIRAKSQNEGGEDEYTPLMEAINEISRSSAIDFSDSYRNKKLIVVSNMYHHSRSLPLNKLCVRKVYLKQFTYYRYKSTWKCPSFEDVKNKRANRFYLEKKIKPKFKGVVDVKMWMLHKKQNAGSIRDASLLTFWEDYFGYVQGNINLLETEFEPDPIS